MKKQNRIYDVDKLIKDKKFGEPIWIWKKK
jgi:hypothetical protein